MKEKTIPTISYCKKNQSPKKQPVLFNKKNIMKAILEYPFDQPEESDYYKIQSDVTFLSFKNVTFYRNIRFICPKDTVLILEDCTFQGPNIYFNGGTVQLTRPKLPSYFYCNNILGNDLESFTMDSKSNFTNSLNIGIQANHITIDGEDRIGFLHLIGKTINITNISKVKELSLEATNVNITNSQIDIKETQEKPQIDTEQLELQNTTITSCDPIIVNYRNIIADKTSSLRSRHSVCIGDHLYTNPDISNKLLVVPSSCLIADTPSLAKEEKNLRKSPSSSPSQPTHGENL